MYRIYFNNALFLKTSCVKIAKSWEDKGYLVIFFEKDTK